MLYSSAGLLALIVHFIVNHDVLFYDGLSFEGRRQGTEDVGVIPAVRYYRRFLISVSVFYITDILWGILYEKQLLSLVFADTALYFVAMAFSILYWTGYVTAYLNDGNAFEKALTVIGNLIFVFQLLMIAVNFFRPVMFSFDADKVYHAEAGRYIILVAQIMMYFLTAVYALIVAAGRKGTTGLRHRTIGLFGLAMSGLILAQTFFPLLPLYTIGCMLGSCVLHSFVLENEKEEYREELEERLQDNILKGNYYDLLTGLPGMTYFLELTEKKREAMHAAGKRPAFVFTSLSGMKFYNQKFGHAEGDHLLKNFAHKLIRAFGADSCSRFGLDQFAVFAEEAGLEETLKKIFSEWEKEYGIEGPSIRAGVYPDVKKDVDISTACDRAKYACDTMRGSYSSCISYYDEELLARAEHKHYILAHLDQAIAEGWIKVFYQPIVRSASGMVCDEEALARWIDPERGFLSPAEFIPVLEDAGLIYKLDLCIIDQVLKKTVQIKEAGLVNVPQSVNLSRADFDGCDIVEEIRRRVDDAGVPRSMLNIEITESIIGSDLDFIGEQIKRFRDLGFRVWLDDFGSGYSSLDVLQSVPVDLIKFDMRFMQQFDSGMKGRVILTELIKMTAGLGVDTVCEGVEREEQKEFLRETGCTMQQGFYYTKPIPLEEIFDRYEKGVSIGFENPDERDYYDAMGRIDLYDLAAVAGGDDDGFRNYFSTIPMAVIEVRGDKIRFARSNRAYRDFMERTFGISLESLGYEFDEIPEGPGRPFADRLNRCCMEGGRALFDERMPDGTTVHSFMRCIAENPVTGTRAAAVAVLAIT